MKIGKFRIRRKALSPVIATLLMVAIAVAAAIITYVWSMGLLGGLMGTGGQQTKEQLILEAYDFRDKTKLNFTLRNVGSVEVTIASVYIEGENLKLTGTVGIGNVWSSGDTTLAGSYSAGASYVLKVVTKTGGTFTFSIIAGRAG